MYNILIYIIYNSSKRNREYGGKEQEQCGRMEGVGNRRTGIGEEREDVYKKCAELLERGKIKIDMNSCKEGEGNKNGELSELRINGRMEVRREG